MLSKIHILFLFVAILMLSCNEDDSSFITQEAFVDVDARLQPFFTSFEEEAAARGLDIDLAATRISAVISEIEGEGIAGQCRRTISNLANDIVIDETFFTNPRVPFLIKELIVFHELGHCFLLRGHREDSLPNGACVSIMRSGIEDCLDNYNSNTRSFYIDELFNPENF